MELLVDRNVVEVIGSRRGGLAARGAITETPLIGSIDDKNMPPQVPDAGF
jgi:hypothetical protein